MSHNVWLWTIQFLGDTNLRANLCLCGLFLLKKISHCVCYSLKFIRFTIDYQAIHAIIICNCPYLWVRWAGLWCVWTFYDLLISFDHIDLCVSLFWLNQKSELAFWRNKIYLHKFQVLFSDIWKLKKDDSNTLPDRHSICLL